jgi:hypothetical protein
MLHVATTSSVYSTNVIKALQLHVSETERALEDQVPKLKTVPNDRSFIPFFSPGAKSHFPSSIQLGSRKCTPVVLLALSLKRSFLFSTFAV